MHNVARTHALHFTRNRRRDHTLCPVPRAQQSNMVNAIQQRNDPSHRIRISERGQRRLQLRSLHRNPKHIDGRHFGREPNIHCEIAEGAVEMKLLGILPKASRLTTSVTESPACARQAPIRPPTPPAPRIACRKGLETLSDM